MPAHSPSIAQAWVQSSGVSALHPIRGVSSKPLLIAPAGSSGTAVVAKNLVRLLLSTLTHSSADLLLAGWPNRLALGARASLTLEVAVPTGGMLASGVAGYAPLQ